MFCCLYLFALEKDISLIFYPLNMHGACERGVRWVLGEYDLEWSCPFLVGTHMCSWLVCKQGSVFLCFGLKGVRFASCGCQCGLKEGCQCGGSGPGAVCSGSCLCLWPVCALPRPLRSCWGLLPGPRDLRTSLWWVILPTWSSGGPRSRFSVSARAQCPSRNYFLSGVCFPVAEA